MMIRRSFLNLVPLAFGAVVPTAVLVPTAVVVPTAVLLPMAMLVPMAVVVPHLHAQLPPLPEAPREDMGPAPRLFVSERLQELGTIVAGDKVAVSWHLANRGTANLLLKRVKAGCGCTVVRLTEEEMIIPPGGSLTLRAEFDSTGRKGEQTKSVTILSNDPVEPRCQLTFHATVDVLYHMRPPGRLNLGAVRQGRTASQTLDITPASGRGDVELLGVQLREEGFLSYSAEPLRPSQPASGKSGMEAWLPLGNGGTTKRSPPRQGVVGRVGIGQRLRFSVADAAPLGRLTTRAVVKFSVGGIQKEVDVKIFGEVVADLVVQPEIVKPAARALPPGRRLAPVTILSTDQKRFEIVSVKAGPPVHATVQSDSPRRPRRGADGKRKPRPRLPRAKGGSGTRYTVLLTVREDAPPGPFATVLEVRTNSLDQPLLRVPVFGMVAYPIDVDPPLVVLRTTAIMRTAVLLRTDGTPAAGGNPASGGSHAAEVTPAGTRRRVRLKCSPRITLEVSEITSGMPEVVATLQLPDDAARGRTTLHDFHQPHVRYLEVKLAGKLPKGVYSTVLTLKTNVPGAERLEIPVTIEVAD